MAKSGGGYVWDHVLEYRVWCHDGDEGDYYYAFATYAEAHECSEQSKQADDPLALVLQHEHINEDEPGQYVHIRVPRITE